MNTSPREQLFTLGVAVMLAVAFVFGLALPRSSTLADVRQEHQQLQTHNETLARENATITTAHREVEQLKHELDLARSRVPVKDQFAEYENSLLKLGRQFELWDLDSEPQITDVTTDRGDSLAMDHRTMKLSFTTDFAKFYDFLRGLESQTRLTRIDRIDISAANGLGDRFTVDLELSIFFGEL